MRLASVALGALLVLGACGTSAAPAVTTPTPTPTPGPRACVASELAMAFRGWNGATGALQGSVGLSNESATRCALSGYATKVELLDGAAAALPLTLDQFKTVAPPATAILEPGTGAVPPKGTPLKAGQASFGLTWMNWCGTQKPLALRLTFADKSAKQFPLGADAAATPRCDDKSKASVLSVGPFEAAAK